MLRDITMAILILGAAQFVGPGVASAQSCDVDRYGNWNCSGTGWSGSGTVDRYGDLSGTIRGTDPYGNTLRGTVGGDLQSPRIDGTITSPSIFTTPNLWPQNFTCDIFGCRSR